MAIDMDLFPEFKESQENPGDNFAEVSHNQKDGAGLISIGDDDDDDKGQRADSNESDSVGDEGKKDAPGDTQDTNESARESSGSDGSSKSKKKGREQKRFDELTYANRMMAAQLEESNRQKQYLQDQLNRKLANVMAENKTLQDHTIEMERYQTIQALKAVKESGDVDLEIQLQDKLSKINAAKAHLDLSPPAYEQVVSSPPPLNDYGAQQYMAPQVSENYLNWLEEHPWANPRDPSSFNPKAALEAADIFDELDVYYDMNGLSNQKQSEEYFNIARKAMAQKYAIGEGAPQQEAPRESYSRPGAVAPVSRGGSNMADQYLAAGGDAGRKYGASVDPRLVKAWRNTTIPVSPTRQLKGDDALQYINSEKLRQMKNRR
jgi:hypothetical protein